MRNDKVIVAKRMLLVLSSRKCWMKIVFEKTWGSGGESRIF
jgi:hypothetical protein